MKMTEKRFRRLLNKINKATDQEWENYKKSTVYNTRQKTSFGMSLSDSMRVVIRDDVIKSFGYYPMQIEQWAEELRV